ncbi:MAG: hypothetical protein WBF17_18435, partial [Phycisphaerae bacterium]
AGEDFAAGVLARARRRGLVRGPGDGSSRIGLWLGRISAAAMLLLAAGVGVIVSATVWKDAPRSPVAAGPDGAGVLLARLSVDHDGSREAADLGGRRIRQAHRNGAARRSGVFAASKRLLERPSPAPTGEITHGEAGVAIERFARLKGPSDADGERSAVVLNSLHVDKLLSVAIGKDATHTEHVELRVTDLAAGRRDVVAILSAAGLRPLDAAASLSSAAVAGRERVSAAAPRRPEEKKEKGFYYQAGAELRTWRAVVVDSPSQLVRITDAVRRISAAVKETAGQQRLCLGDTILTKAGTGALPPVVTSLPSPAEPKAPASQAESEGYHVARLQRLPDANGPETAQAKAAATAPGRDVARLLVITLHLDTPGPTTTQMRPQLDARQRPTTSSPAQ